MKSTLKTHTLLHVDASPRGERSYSRRLGTKFVTAWQSAHPDAAVINRDIGREPPPFVSEAWVEGAFAPADQQSPAARAAIGVSNGYVDELLSADELVITTPMYNLSVPAVLKAWIDQVVRVGRTFAINNGAFQGLARAKRAIVVVASGSDYRVGSAGSSYNFLEPYLRAVLGFIGITTVEFVYAHSLGSGQAVASQAVNEAEAAVTDLAAQVAA
ncbi:MAG: NAD(P)H-dependent oxidoreductase [Opitutus sp.]